MSKQQLLVGALVGVLLVAWIPFAARADITCYDFTTHSDAQAVLDALPGDPFGLDVGWPWSSPDMGDLEASNGLACDTGTDIPENPAPGNEPYDVGADTPQNGRSELPSGVEQATISDASDITQIRTVEKSDLVYAVNGVATPDFETGGRYEADVFDVQCGAVASQDRVQELLAPGTTVWMEVDEVYWGGNMGMGRTSRHVWIEMDGRYRLLSEVLISEGMGVAAPERPGTARGDALTNPPDGIMYRDALREAQKLAIDAGVGIWATCA